MCSEIFKGSLPALLLLRVLEGSLSTRHDCYPTMSSPESRNSEILNLIITYDAFLNVSFVFFIGVRFLRFAIFCFYENAMCSEEIARKIDFVAMLNHLTLHVINT